MWENQKRQQIGCFFDLSTSKWFQSGQWLCISLSYVFSRQKEERSVLLGVGCLEFVTEPEPPLVLEFQPAHRLPEGASIRTDDTQSRTCRGAGTAALSDHFRIVLRYTHRVWLGVFAPLRNEKFLRNLGVTKESAKQSKRPLKSSPTVLMLTEWGLELTKHTVTCRQTLTLLEF